MAKSTGIHPSDLLGLSRLAIDATTGMSSLVEALHDNIARSPLIFSKPSQGPTGGIAGLVYSNIRLVTGLLGGGINNFLAPLVPLTAQRNSSPQREAMLATLNGVIGDYLVATNNPLAIPMRLRWKGEPLTLERQALAAAIPRLTGKVAVLVHGLCRNDLQWKRNRHDHGAGMARDLGYTPVYLHFNSGLHVSTNGRAFSQILDTLIDQWPVPVEDFVIVAHSMGGLVSRSAHHYAVEEGHKWPRLLRKILFLATPHHGAPLERLGNVVTTSLRLSPYTDAFARLAEIRSAGITDLRYGSLLDDDWAGRERFGSSGDPRRPVPLPEGVQCYAIAANLATQGGCPHGPIGDGIVPLDSALGRHRDLAMNLSFAESRQWIAYAMSHFDVLSKSAVYRKIVQWLTE